MTWGGKRIGEKPLKGVLKRGLTKGNLTCWGWLDLGPGGGGLRLGNIFLRVELKVKEYEKGNKRKGKNRNEGGRAALSKMQALLSVS